MALVMYTMIAGLAVPLGPGIVSVNPTTITTGMNHTIRVNGYNNQFDKAKDTKAFLRFEEGVLESTSINVINYNSIDVTFNLPTEIPGNDTIAFATLIVNNELDGSSVYPKGIVVKETRSDTIIGVDLYKENVSGISDPGLFRFPYRSVLNETIRNTFFHVTLWFSMFILLITSVYYAIQYLRTKRLDYDHKSKSFTIVAILFGIMGLITGSIWARFTWGAWWTPDVKLNMSAVAMLIYAAYLVLRGSIPDQDQEAKLASAYNIFAFVALIPLVFVIPRLTDSLHPGNGGNPALGGEDLDNTLRMIFYPSIIGMTLIGVWMSTLYYRIIILKEKILLK